MMCRIDQYIDNSTVNQAYRLETYRASNCAKIKPYSLTTSCLLGAAGSISATASQQPRCYFVSKCVWASPPPPATSHLGDASKKRTDIRSVSDRVFLERASENTLEIYQQVMWNVEGRYGPVIEKFEVEGTNERRVVIGYKMGGTRHIFRYVIRLLSRFYDLLANNSSMPVHCQTCITSTRYTRPENTSVSCSNSYP